MEWVLGLRVLAFSLSLWNPPIFDALAIRAEAHKLPSSHNRKRSACFVPCKNKFASITPFRIDTTSANGNKLMHLASISSLDTTRLSSREGGITHFIDLLKRNVINPDFLDNVDYKKRCSEALKSIVGAFPVALSEYTGILFDNDNLYNFGSKRGQDTSPNTLKESKILLENAFLGAIKTYLDLTGAPTVTRRLLWFERTTKEKLTREQFSIRSNYLVELILGLENDLYSAFRQCVSRCKMSFISKVFNERSADGANILKLTDAPFIASIKREYTSLMQQLVPFFFGGKGNWERDSIAGFIKKFLRSVLLVEYFDKIDCKQITGQDIRDELSVKLLDLCSRWTVEKDVEELSSIADKLNTGAKSLLDKHLKNTVQQGKLMKMIVNQQNQLELFKRQLDSPENRSTSPLICGFSYRFPDSNFNIVANVKRGKGQIQITCVPDESAHFLGPYGFTQGVPPGNLGLSFNIDF